MKIVIEVPMLFRVEVPDDMPDAEVRRRVWEELRDGTETVWSSSGFNLQRIAPKRARVWQALAYAIRDRAYWKRHYETARALRKARRSTGTSGGGEG